MYLIWSLLREGLVTVNDLDPLGVHLHNPLNHVASKPSLRFLSVYDDSVIQIALISESSKLQTILTTYGIPTQTVKQIEPITLNAPGELLLKVYSYLGKNEKLGLSGRPMRPVGAIGSSKVYQVFGHLNVFYPADLNMTDFYMSYDIKLFIDTVQSIIRFLNSYWNNRGRPTVTILLQQNLFQGGYFKDMISFLAQLKNGDVCGIRVRLDRLQALISMSCVDILECVSVEEEMAIKSSLTSRSGRLRSVSSSNSLSHSASSLSIAVDDVFNDDTLQSTSSVTTFSDEKPDYGPSTLANYDIEYLVHLFNNETNLVGKLYLLHEIINKTNSDFLIDHVTAVEHLKDVYNISTSRKHWMAVRLGASFLHKVVDCLAPSLTHMLVKEKEVSFGVFGFTEHIVTEPLTPKEISNIIYERCTPYEPIEAALQQELVIYLGDMITRSDMSEVFDGMVCLRLG
jgi:phosphorylase kinase alpha/beta subunit